MILNDGQVNMLIYEASNLEKGKTDFEIEANLNI